MKLYIILPKLILRSSNSFFKKKNRQPKMRQIHRLIHMKISESQLISKRWLVNLKTCVKNGMTIRNISLLITKVLI